jgi:hypothetical protein
MQEPKYVSELIKLWAEAREEANQNTALMIDNDFSESVMEECARRMKRVRFCEAELMELSNSISKVLDNFIEARKDKGCMFCWTASRIVVHKDCWKKMDRYFQTETDLLIYAKTIDK